GTSPSAWDNSSARRSNAERLTSSIVKDDGKGDGKHDFPNPGAASAIPAQACAAGQPEATMSRSVALTLQELAVDHVHTTLEPEDWQWQPSLKEALEGLTAAQAAWKPAPEPHSIWQ